MCTVQDIEAAVEQLAPEQRAQFRAWFDAFDAREWDQQMDQDLDAGQLDWLADKALGDLRAGRCVDRCSNAPVLASGPPMKPSPLLCGSWLIGPINSSKPTPVTHRCTSNASAGFFQTSGEVGIGH